jgi:hypothetical protein
VKLPDSIAKQKQGAAQAKAGLDESVSKHSAQANVGTYHFEQGQKNLDQPAISGMQMAAKGLTALWDDLLYPAVKAVGDSASGAAQTLMDAFDSGKDISVAEIMQQLGGAVIHAVIQFCKAIITGLMKLGEDIIMGLREMITSRIEWPVIGPLLRKFGVPDISLLDIIAMILAFPVTILSKVITGAAPTRITSFDYKVSHD